MVLERETFAAGDSFESLCQYALLARTRLASVRSSHSFLHDKRLDEGLDQVKGDIEDLIFALKRIEAKAFREGSDQCPR